jgi:cell division transport system permease protein
LVAFVVFSMRRAWSGFWYNKFASVAATASMVIMLSMLSGLLILLSGLDSTLKGVESQVEVVAYLKESATPADISQLTAELQDMPDVKTVAFISKEKALANFKARQPEVASLVDSLPTNPLPASFEIGLRDPSGYEAVATYLNGQAQIESVQDIKKTVNRLISVMNGLRTGGVVILILVTLVVLFVIVNTIRLAVVGRSQEIEIMRLVGASDAFIRWPFVFEGALVGLFGALVTVGILALIQAPLAQLMTQFFNVLPVQANAIVGQNVAAIVLLAGVGIGMIGSYVSVRSYLTR